MKAPKDETGLAKESPSNAFCPGCGSSEMNRFYELSSVPANSCILNASPEEAINCPKGDISLNFCSHCGFVWNGAYNPRLTEYSRRYEETQGFSSTFNAFQYDLAVRLIGRYNLYGKDIIEIGCGKGEFLTLLCRLGDNRGVGFDPAFVEERSDAVVSGQIRFIRDFYSAKYAYYQGDFICCKMTLEHIPDPSGLAAEIRRSMGNRLDCIVFIQVPDATRILRDCALEDIYYEHCSYFTPGSLARLLNRCGFDTVHTQTDYRDQYLMMEATPTNGQQAPSIVQEHELEELKGYISLFQENYIDKVHRWHTQLERLKADARRTVLWGSGSKAVAFLASVEISDVIRYVVDINPYKHGHFMPGTGQEIVSPDFLKDYRPNTVIIMNPIYLDEIRQNLQALGLHPQILTL